MTVSTFKLCKPINSIVLERRKLVNLDCKDISRTKQSEKDVCDINNIIVKYKKTGLVTHLSKHQGVYDDFTSVPTYHEALQRCIEVESMFNSLPAFLRESFDNDPTKFLDFVSNPANHDSMVKMGLAKAKDPAANTSAPAGELSSSKTDLSTPKDPSIAQKP